MAAKPAFNKNNSAVKRIMQEARELANDPCTDYAAAPLEDDIFEWHCTLRGTPGTEFEGGLYHFRILLPAEYPFRPPSIMMLTPNGRFELNTKICISFTSYHEELWQPAWGVRTAILGLQGFFPLKGTAAVGVGAVEYPTAERKRLAALSREWVCPTCKCPNLECLPDPPVAAIPSAAPATPDSNASEPYAVDAAAPSRPAEQQTSQEQDVPSPQDVPSVSTSQSASTQASSPAPSPSPSPTIPLVAPIPKRPNVPAAILTQRIPTPPVQHRKEEHPPSSLTPGPAPIDRTQRTQPSSDLLAAAMTQSTRRPPVLLDTAICVLLVLVLALLAKKVF